MSLFRRTMPFSEEVFSLPLLEGRSLPVTTADLLVMLGMLLLYVEVLKAARLGSKGVMDHVLSFALFVGMAAELVLVPRAMTPTLLLLTTLAWIEALRAGGNAGDAGVTGVAVLGVVEPQMTGIGGDCFGMVSVPGQPVWGYNGSGRAGAHASTEALIAQGIHAIAPNSIHA